MVIDVLPTLRVSPERLINPCRGRGQPQHRDILTADEACPLCLAVSNRSAGRGMCGVPGSRLAVSSNPPPYLPITGVTRAASAGPCANRAATMRANGEGDGQQMGAIGELTHPHPRYPHQAHTELDTLAVSANTDQVTEGSQILATLTPGGPAQS